jgi:hypothetical protein
MKDYLNEQMRKLRQGCKEQIYVNGYEGEEPTPIGWYCGEKTREGIMLYCNSCWKKISNTQRKINKLERGLGE